MQGFQPKNDFLIIVDKKEPIELLRPQSDLILDVAAAWRLSSVHRLNATSATESDESVWFLAETALGELEPMLGDTLKDATGSRWTISECTHLDKIGCWIPNF